MAFYLVSLLIGICHNADFIQVPVSLLFSIYGKAYIAGVDMFGAHGLNMV